MGKYNQVEVTLYTPEQEEEGEDKFKPEGYFICNQERRIIFSHYRVECPNFEHPALTSEF